MRMFNRYGEKKKGKKLYKASRMMRRLYRRWFECEDDFSTEERLQAEYRLERIRQFERSRKEGLSVEASLRVVEMSRNTLYRWRRLHRHYGMAGLVDESRARKTPPQRTARTAAAVELIRSMREKTTWCKEILSAYLLNEHGVRDCSTADNTFTLPFSILYALFTMTRCEPPL